MTSSSSHHDMSWPASISPVTNQDYKFYCWHFGLASQRGWRPPYCSMHTLTCTNLCANARLWSICWMQAQLGELVWGLEHWHFRGFKGSCMHINVVVSPYILVAVRFISGMCVRMSLLVCPLACGHALLFPKCPAHYDSRCVLWKQAPSCVVTPLPLIAVCHRFMRVSIFIKCSWCAVARWQVRRCPWLT